MRKNSDSSVRGRVFFRHRGSQIQIVAAEESASKWTRERAALVIAHPGHELRIHHWLECARPVTFVLTDGSGHTNNSRLASTTAVLKSAGARSGSIYGAMSDRQLYQALLSGEYHVFERLVEELASALLRERVTYVAGDAVEGVNPGHDVCRILLNAALLCIDQRGGPRLTNLEYPVEASPQECPAEDLSEAIVLKLDDDAYARKMDAARSYPEMAKEIERVFKVHDVDVFRVECLRPVRYGLDIGNRFSHPCVYESYGEKQVAAGIYTEVVRFREHLAPLAEHLAIHCGATS